MRKIGTDKRWGRRDEEMRRKGLMEN